MQWSYLFTLPILAFVAWQYTISVVRSRFPQLRNKSICLLIAHPDDEAMFFAPTVLALTQPELGNHVKILCLSSGDADGLGEIRKKELVKSGMGLGLRKEEDVFVIESPDFPDSMKITWDKQKIADLLTSAFVPSAPKRKDKNTPPTTSIDILITFDAGGISSHPNHISLYHGSRHFISSLLRDHSGWQSPVDLYTLTSISIFRKYTSFVDTFMSLIFAAFGGREIGAHPSPLLFMSGIEEVRIAQKAMTTAHKSQMRWFRWGWIGLSRYMSVNDLRLEKIGKS
ncbi:N-acetylglucosaminyl-phosphatidylinositol de-N-acetylase protein [Rutstroemia sp. NJR-2017a WRK4]|nr:N-acetylglucosaminyl-phosphatidylinositol de-N-acetylase protein [Rutstroemia sp. NJR-2017a WRK4]